MESSTLFYPLLLPLLQLLLLISPTAAISVNTHPRQNIQLLSGVLRFDGENRTEDEHNHFKLLEHDGDSLLVGARNKVYNLSIASMKAGHEMKWAPPYKVVETCTMKGKTADDCQNYIRVLAKQAEGQVLICGTYAFSPKCRIYRYDAATSEFKVYEQFDGEAISPYSPHDNSTAIYLRKTDEIISGTVSDFVGNDPLIYRRRLTKGRSGGEEGIRTQRDDVRVLDNPNFVASFEYKEHIYFWLREKAAEAVDNNEERQVYARVARVCKEDKGGPRPSHDKWTTFLKARLNCSLGAAATPFYFNELKAVADPVPSSSSPSDHLVYAVFSTPDSSVRMSAVCVFSMQTIRETFDKGTFKYQRTGSSQWTSLARSEIPSPRPGACAADSAKLPETTVSFVMRNPLMHQAVSSIRGPLLVEGSERAELTQIAVLSSVASVDGGRHDVIYVGTSDGRVVKAIQIGNETVVIQSALVFPSGAPVVNLLTTDSRLIVVSPDEVASIPPESCGFAPSCSACVRLQDPHCAWDERLSRCVSRSDGSGWRLGDVIQNVVRGESPQCPLVSAMGDDGDNGIVLGVGAVISPRLGSTELPTSSPPYTGQTIALACLVCVILASVCGFFVGFRIASARRLVDAHHSASSTSGSDYDSFGRARLTRHDSLTAASVKLDPHVIYGGGGGGTMSKHSVDATSLVIPAAMSMSHHGGSSGTTTPGGRDRNALMTSLNNTTLPRDYKVKKVYL
ncbi:hypothetical protein PFISCL1PPCAC_20880 [Pristionchus fissidentatus]|uniref:Semaphorin-1A n=1 Tax=Pristionchus fissidentatus TaxID=1538716 RepID=A0AAV5WDK6_9BILA|nr:hypothetical protein PFISCL1PPCAC_20880 [Pristionchus fissidentatus]